MAVLRSKDNPRVRRWQRLVRDARARRAAQRAIIEGPHLVGAYLASGGTPVCTFAGEEGALKPEIASLLRRSGTPPLIVSKGVFQAIADTETPVAIAAEIPLPQTALALADSPCAALLEGIQDAGNVGAILRSAAGFGVRDVVLGPGCADPWSPKVLRAGMGAHFGLRVGTSRNLAEEVERFRGTVVCTVPRDGVPLAEAGLKGRIAWIFGAEGQGVSEVLARRATLSVTIPMPGGAESLNVAAAAAICFYEFSRRAARS